MKKARITQCLREENVLESGVKVLNHYGDHDYRALTIQQEGQAFQLFVLYILVLVTQMTMVRLFGSLSSHEY